MSEVLVPCSTFSVGRRGWAGLKCCAFERGDQLVVAAKRERDGTLHKRPKNACPLRAKSVRSSRNNFESIIRE